MSEYGYILKNYNDVKLNIEEAKKEINSSKDVCLVAVSKNNSIEKIEFLAKNGVKDFGENKVQELLPKVEALEKYKIDWHFIGHLQKNKVKYVIGKVKYIHSVDSIELAEIIDKESKKRDIVTNIFLQVNIGKDFNKFGFEEKEVKKVFESIDKLDNIRVVGLMTILPILDDIQNVESLYQKMYAILLDICANLIDNSSELYLSMGMSNDYALAIKNGANFVRVGTSVFGKNIQEE
ncbi:MAG: YggS family pyridoxal phosphate-dependent enzyme [Lachnospirales bacterium]